MYILCFFFFFFPPGYVALWDSKTSHRPVCERVSYCVETSPPSQLPPQDRSLSLTLCLSLYLLYFVLPLFEEIRLPFLVPSVLHYHLEVVLWKLLSLQMIFWWICGAKVVSTSYSSAILGPLTVLINYVTTSRWLRHLKCPPTMRKTWDRSLGWKDPLDKEMATHCSTLTWKIPWTEECGRLQSTGLQRVRHDWATSLS